MFDGIKHINTTASKTGVRTECSVEGYGNVRFYSIDGNLFVEVAIEIGAYTTNDIVLFSHNRA